MNYHGICPECKKPNTGRAWCNKCDPGKFLKEGKTTGNSEINNFIYEAQLKTMDYGSNIEWIPYDRLQDIKPIGEGGFSNVFSATWLDGEPNYDHSGIKKRSKPITVALKKLKSSENKMEAFINECKIFHDCNIGYYNSWFIKLYGITKEPQTEEFIMVLQFAKYGDLRNYLKNNINWKEKLNILYGIAYNLNSIHDENYVHKDLHIGNILQFNNNLFRYDNTKITGLGQAQKINNSKTSNISNVCGVLPYIAPEVLDGKPYTKKSDIYSFGIIMVEVSTGKPPYLNVPHDHNLALAICNGLRPRVAKGTPQRYIDLVNKCLDANPKKRPSAEELSSIIYAWSVSLPKEFIDADKIIAQKSSTETTSHSEAIYTSRFMKLNNLSKPINTTRVQIEDLEVSDSQLIDLHISGEFRSKNMKMMMNKQAKFL